MSKIDPSLYIHNQPSTRVPKSELGKEDFLKLLMAQLQNQDPTSPMEDREFIAQLAQFTSLEQMTNMTNSINELVQYQQMNTIVEYSHLIGKTVSYQKIAENGASIEPISSEVIAVSQFNGQAIIELENGDKIVTEHIFEIKQSVQSEQPDQSEELVDV